MKTRHRHEHEQTRKIPDGSGDEEQRNTPCVAGGQLNAELCTESPLLCYRNGNPGRRRWHDALTREVETMFRTGYHHHLEPPEAHRSRGTLPDGRSDTILAHDRALSYGVRMAVNPNRGQGTCGGLRPPRTREVHQHYRSFADAPR